MKHPIKREALAFSLKLQALKSSLAQDIAQLNKAYPKILSEADKAIHQKMMALKAARLKTKTTAGLTRRRPAATKMPSANLMALTKSLALLKIEKTALQSEFKKVSALQKTMKMALIKRSKPSRKMKKTLTTRSRRKSIAAA